MLSATASARSTASGRQPGPVSCPSRQASHRQRMAARSSSALAVQSRRRTRPGKNTMASARISPVLAVTLPIALPMARSACPCAAAMVDTSSSGRVVARLTTVAPMRNCGIPLAAAIQQAASTNKSPPFTVSTNPRKNITHASQSPAIAITSKKRMQGQRLGEPHKKFRPAKAAQQGETPAGRNGFIGLEPRQTAINRPCPRPPFSWRACRSRGRRRSAAPAQRAYSGWRDRPRPSSSPRRPGRRTTWL